ncbi:hypothetical protein ACQP1K_17055 [Sphaerimonospora sp. CA-214678]|uniref:hypothetical protein n=1 Tax=Sphaerimonospora sp. CA-214678 TaxID=3240029 RepID=UPI003D8F2BE1
MTGDTREYVITVKPHDGDHATAFQISAIVRLDEESIPHIVELTVRSSDRGDDNMPRSMGAIDFERLTNALLSTVTASAHMTAVPTTSRRQQERPVKRGSDTGQRPYRKMPAVDDVKAVFLKTGSVGQVAKHFDVPRYTAQAWVDRLRREGVLAAPATN